MTDRELMQQALDALEKLNKDGWILADFEDEVYASIEALRARLAQPEPYAAQAAMVAQQTQGRMYVDPVTGDVGIGTVKWDASSPLVVHPHPAFQTTEPQREWIGLTDEELLDIADMAYANDLELLQTLQAKLKEKNHG